MLRQGGDKVAGAGEADTKQERQQSYDDEFLPIEQAEKRRASGHGLLRATFPERLVGHQGNGRQSAGDHEQSRVIEVPEDGLCEHRSDRDAEQS